MTNKEIRTRIAPSPTGDPHIGTAYIGIFNLAFARQNGGKFIVRIEDTDRERYVDGTDKIIIENLNWLGIKADESPEIGGIYAPYVQSQRLDIYKEYIKKLLDNKSAYYCFCTKKRLEELRNTQMHSHTQPKYDKKCLALTKEEVDINIKEGKEYVIRLNVKPGIDVKFNDLIRGEIAINTESIDDQVLIKNDGYPTYHFASVVDDHLMKITHIIRGEEWISSTPKHILLYNAFGWEIPEFAHTSLLRNKDRSKISKRKNNTSILWYREQGYLPEAIINFLILLGWSNPSGEEVISTHEFIKKFSFDRMTKSGPIFDIDKLNWINGVYIRKKSIEELKKLIKPYLKYEIKPSKLDRILKIIQERLKKLNEINDLISFFIEDISVHLDLLHEKYDRENTDKILNYALKILKDNGINKDSELKLKEYALKEKYNVGDFFMVVRVATCGRKVSPPLIDTLDILGIEEVEKRIKNSIGR